ncbi:hypothetical protein [Acetivibrio sp. MSJd-27]|jgi:hypothetical protein|uniref:hypothetical protein n=1 Tax=Acetivibrio sp. MSJd-27 TaxID=2841523 RepID=UPI001C0F6337|nr:hypothetical protein [Acetivibrio sp. MSJd-27]MBU5451537.1 hypothetical protein [Acetivibrio sp. MSJd-27]
MKNFTNHFKKADIGSQKILLWFLRFSVLFLAYGFLYYTHILNGQGYFVYFESIYTFIESAFYLLATGIAAATIFEWMIRKNK